MKNFKRILLVEDDPGDIELILTAHGWGAGLSTDQDGQAITPVSGCHPDHMSGE